MRILSTVPFLVLFLVRAASAADATSAPPPATRPMIQHVVVIGLDGCRPEAIQRNAGPVLKDLLKDAAVSWQAQAVKPSVTQVNWAAMLSGCTPARTGIDKLSVTQEELAGMKIKVQTVFQALDQAGKSSVGFLGHWKLYPLQTDTPRAHFERSPGTSTTVAPMVARYLREKKPEFCFVWIGDLDGAGHKNGWLSPEQLAKMEPIDKSIGQIISALKEADLWSTTLIIITSDHGGHGKAHGEGTAEDTTIPWICIGPGVRKGAELKEPINTYDTAATVLHALGVKQPTEWEGKAVLEAFETRERAKDNR